MSMKDMMVCGRKAYLRQAVPSGIIKASILRKIAKDTLLDSPFNIKESDLAAKVDAAFAAASTKMLGFEAESECARMKVLLWRYLVFEQHQSNTIVAQEFTNKVKVMGQEHEVSAHRLIDRGAALECVRYLYKAPDMSRRGQTVLTNPAVNPDLLALQRCGEAEAAKRGIKKPVFGSYYYLKSKNDRSKQLSPVFEESQGSNIINYCFTTADERAMAELYKEAKEDLNDCTCDEGTCYNCQYKDLCHAEFVKRHLEDLPAVEETPLDSIRMTKTQRQFILFDDGQCRVNAVAGSGKTTVVTLRTLRLIEDGCPENEILMITFTEKAKEEMRSRLRRYANGSTLKEVGIKTDEIAVETFNSFGQKLLDEHYDKLGFTQPPALVDEVVKKDIIVGLLENHRSLPLDYRNPFLGLPNAVGAVVQMAQIIDVLKANHAETPADVEELLVPELAARAKEILEIYHAYNAKLVELNMIDYEDQLRLILRLRAYGVFAALPYQHIVVDEFQDSDLNQINLILELAKEDANLKSVVVVGDELQASVMRSYVKSIGTVSANT